MGYTYSNSQGVFLTALSSTRLGAKGDAFGIILDPRCCALLGSQSNSSSKKNRLNSSWIAYRRMTSKDRVMSSYLKITCYYYTAENIQEIKLCVLKRQKITIKNTFQNYHLVCQKKKWWHLAIPYFQLPEPGEKEDTPFTWTEPRPLPRPPAKATPRSPTCSDRENRVHQNISLTTY